jgi:hypothetical protein
VPDVATTARVAAAGEAVAAVATGAAVAGAALAGAAVAWVRAWRPKAFVRFTLPPEARASGVAAGAT